MNVMDGLVGVAVAMRTLEHRVMPVMMVAVAVGMGVFMRQRLVLMAMIVGFGQMQRHTCHH